MCANSTVCTSCSSPYVLVFDGTCQDPPTAGGIYVPASKTTGNTKCTIAELCTLTYAPTSDMTLTLTAPSDFKGFITLDNAQTNSFTFTPAKTSANLSICSYATTANGTYAFGVALSGTNASSYSLSSTILNLTVKEMVTLGFPTDVQVPRCGCSTVQNITISNGALIGPLNITVGTGKALRFGLHPSNVLTVDTSSVFPIPFTICSDGTVAKDQKLTPTIFFSGESSPVVQSNANQVKVTITATPAPVFTLDDPITDFLSGQKFCNISAKGNVNGKLYYQLRETDKTSMEVSLDFIRSSIQANRTVIQSQADFLTHMHAEPRDTRVGVVDLTAGISSPIILYRYFPSTKYLLCGYLQASGSGPISNLTCKTLTTPPEEDPIFVAIATLVNETLQLSPTERQATVCYWQSFVPSASDAFVTNFYGDRCQSLGFQPLFKYPGQVSENGEATFLLITNDTSSATQQAV